MIGGAPRGLPMLGIPLGPLLCISRGSLLSLLPPFFSLGCMHVPCESPEGERLRRKAPALNACMRSACSISRRLHTTAARTEEEETLQPLNLQALMQDIEEYLIPSSSSSSNSSNSSSSSSINGSNSLKGPAAERLFAYLPLLSASRVQQLPAADLLLLLRVYSRLFTAEAPLAAAAAGPAAAAAAAGEAAGEGACGSSKIKDERGGAAANKAAICLFLNRGAATILRRPLDFMLPSQLPCE